MSKICFIHTKSPYHRFFGEMFRVAVWSAKTTAAKGFVLGIVSGGFQRPVKDLERYALFGPVKISLGQSFLRGGTSKEG